MAAETERRQDMSTTSHPKRLRHLLGLIQAGVGLSAILGGARLVSDPTGASAALPLDWLQGSPFSDYFIPGLLLLVAIGLGTSVAAGATWLGFHRAGLLAMASGLVLVVFILTEVWMVGLRTFLQPLFLGLGLLILALGLAAHRQILPAAPRPEPHRPWAGSLGVEAAIRPRGGSSSASAGLPCPFRHAKSLRRSGAPGPRPAVAQGRSAPIGSCLDGQRAAGHRRDPYRTHK
jgi:hypothetical protein